MRRPIALASPAAETTESAGLHYSVFYNLLLPTRTPEFWLKPTQHSASMSSSSQEIVRSYRHLYRHALHAVQYSSPARFTVRDVLESTFRAGNAADFQPQRIKNTLEFLSCAAKETGLEHKILKSLLFTWWWENKNRAIKECDITFSLGNCWTDVVLVNPSP